MIHTSYSVTCYAKLSARGAFISAQVWREGVGGVVLVGLWLVGGPVVASRQESSQNSRGRERTRAETCWEHALNT